MRLARKVAELAYRNITDGKPVSWSDGNSTVWMVDPSKAIAVKRGGNIVKVGAVYQTMLAEHSFTVRIAGGPCLCYEVGD